MEDPHIGKSGAFVLDAETGLTISEADYQTLLRERATQPAEILTETPAVSQLTDTNNTEQPAVVDAGKSTATKPTKGV